MENLMFVAWLLGWPIVCSITDKLSPWEGDIWNRNDIATAAIVRILVWVGVAIALYRQ